MPFGISPAPELFQQRVDTLVRDIHGVEPVFDDILVYGEGDTDQQAVEGHDGKLEKLSFKIVLFSRYRHEVH